VCDARTAASVLDHTIGLATQLDRAIGDEANAGGTSYLGPRPLDLLGRAVVGAPLLSVVANRSAAQGLATVAWDDEGVIPSDTTLVRDGILMDYQTTRASASLLAPWYTTQHRTVRSNGCAAAPDALSITMQHAPNLSLVPSRTPVTLDQLIADTKKGLLVMAGRADTDFQAKNGTLGGVVREITNGKLGGTLTGEGFLFNATEFWKNLVAVGSDEDAGTIAASHHKGQPDQEMQHTVRAVPIKVKNVAAVDLERKS